MRKMQDIILESISNEVKRYELELVVNFKNSYNGMAYIVDGFKTIIYFSFGFGENYFSVVVKNEDNVEVLKKEMVFYHKYKDIKSVIDWFDNYCREYDMEKVQ